MKKLRLKLIWFCINLILVVYCSNPRFNLLAQQPQYDLIESTVKLSVCGNGIIEGGEDCEGENLGGETCQSQGYGPGTLACDISCSFDFFDCAPPSTPTPSPTVTPTRRPSPTSTITITPAVTLAESQSLSGDEVKKVEGESIDVKETSTITEIPTALPTPLPVLPEQLTFYDLDGNGKIDLSEKVDSIKVWVNHWRQTLGVQSNRLSCDLNLDKRCDLIDFSILLYYVNRQ